MRLIKSGMGDYETLNCRTSLETLERMHYMLDLQDYIEAKTQMGI